MKPVLHTALITAGLILNSACTSSEQPSPETDAGMTTPDAGPVDAGPLAARYLVPPKGLFGDTPVSNRFLNPNFDLNAEGWLAYPTMSGATRLPSVQRRFEPHTPTRQPLLVMPKDGNDFGVGVVGTARAGAGAFDITVWFGRPTEAAAEPVTASIVGMHITDGEMAWDLSPLEGTEQVIAERTWVQYGLHMNEGPVGFANLVITDDSSAPIFVTGPVMIPGTIQRPQGPAVDLSGKPRHLGPRETRAMQAMAQRFKKNLGRVAPTRPLLPRTAPQR